MFIHDQGSERQIRKPSAELAPEGCEGSKSHVPAQKKNPQKTTHAECARKYTHIPEKKEKSQACCWIIRERVYASDWSATPPTNALLAVSRHVQTEAFCPQDSTIIINLRAAVFLQHFFFFFIFFFPYISRWESLLNSGRCLTLICQQPLSCHDRQHAQKNTARDAVYLPCTCVYACVRTYIVKMARRG